MDALSNAPASLKRCAGCGESFKTLLTCGTLCQCNVLAEKES